MTLPTKKGLFCHGPDCEPPRHRSDAEAHPRDQLLLRPAPHRGRPHLSARPRRQGSAHLLGVPLPPLRHHQGLYILITLILMYKGWPIRDD